jgi:hypothetical protein
VKDAAEVKKARLESKMETSSQELARIKADHEALCEFLVDKFNTVIEDTVNTHVAELETTN